ncbi:mogroside IE synthase-like [Cornus florida]|uniref:mogroside IE synthase-like n=1 Tax=Cornus florida TaxID=4283 RepID=UPI0028A0D9D2|nr:mogroside IE synthase-like [Cornus florida]
MALMLAGCSYPLQFAALLDESTDQKLSMAADWMEKIWCVRTIGPTLPSMYLDKRMEDDTDHDINLFKPKAAMCINWLNEKPRGSFYVAFGSMAEVDAEQMEEVAWGLKESMFYFLWVVRASEEAKLPEKFTDDVSERGLIVTWSQQLEVLAHESVGCFVTHSGLIY